MPKRSPRPLTLADMMVLIAAIAASFPLARWIRAQPRMVPHVSYISPGAGNWLDYVYLMEPSCPAVALTLVLIPLRWRRPRPSPTRVVRQPGAVACLAMASAMVAGLAVEQAQITIGAASYAPGVMDRGYMNLWYWEAAVDSIPLAILGAWTALAVGGRWSPEPSWIDRLGRILGVFWLAKYPITLFRFVLNHWLPYKN